MAFWIMLIWVTACYLFLREPMNERVRCEDGGYEYRPVKSYVFFLFSVPLLLIATRTDFVDTASYIGSFKNLPSDFGQFYQVDSFIKARLFNGLQMLFKMFISDNAAVWIAFIACLQAFLVLRTLKQYSVDVGFSIFMMVATSIVGSWMCNGIRQFIAVAILFACTGWLLRGKRYLYLILAVFLMGLGPIAPYLKIEHIPWYLDGIHQSVLVAALSVFVINGKAFNKRLWILVGVLVVLIVTGGLDEVLGSSVENTVYTHDLEYIDEDTGTNIFRVLLQAVPLALALFGRKDIMKPETPQIIHLSVNCSVVNTVLYVASAFTSGMLVGRLPIFFEMYNLILLPWLLSHPYKQYRTVFTLFIMMGYTVFFWYQINVVWRAVPFVSFLPGFGG